MARGPSSAIVALALALLCATPASGQTRPAGGRLLDVPYVAQSADLCGGAALAMVLRYWGDRSAVAEEFARLVDPAGGGITAGALVDAARARGWRAVPAAGADARLVQSHVAEGRPPMALIEERPGVLHYVVVVAWTGDEVIVHDPARSPFRVMTREDFDRRWSVTNRWMLIVLPAEDGGEGASARPPAPAPPPPGQPLSAAAAAMPCDDLLTRGIAASRSGEMAQAERLLQGATGLCPAAAGPWRELSGLRFVQQRWADAERLADEAVRIAPDDAHAWRVLAAARYQQSDLKGALRAMERTGESAIDLVQVTGAASTPLPVVIRAAGLEPREPLTAEGFARSRRRLGELPAAGRSRLDYRPAEGGGLTVEAVVAERERWPRRWAGWAVVGARAAADRTLRIDLAGLARSGETWSGIWRWSARRPLAGFRLETPAPAGLPGVAAIDAIWERQSYAGAIGDGEMVEASRRRVGLALSDWATGSLRWSAEVAADRFDGRSLGSLGGALEWRRFDDRVAAGIAGAAWAGSRRVAFGEWSIGAAWRSSPPNARPSWSIRSGLTAASGAAPLAIWPGAGTGGARPALLRAHPLLEDEVVAGEAFGRRLWHASLEHARPVWRHPAADVSVVGFADGARAWRRRDGLAPMTHVDVGMGVRIGTLGMPGSLDVNIAYGLRDGRVTVSAGVRAPWPGAAVRH